MGYRQLSITVDGQPFAEEAVPESNTGAGFAAQAREFAIAGPGSEVKLWSRMHGHILRGTCLTCPAGQLTRFWNAPRSPMMRSAAHAGLMELDPSFGKTEMEEASRIISAVLAEFYDSGELDLYGFIGRRVRPRSAAT